MSTSVYSPDYKMKYSATAAADVVVKAGAGKLHSILVGAAVGSSTIEVSDHASDGDGNVVIFLSGDALGPREYIIDAEFSVGICADIANQTKVTFIYS